MQIVKFEWVPILQLIEVSQFFASSTAFDLYASNLFIARWPILSLVHPNVQRLQKFDGHLSTDTAGAGKSVCVCA